MIPERSIESICASMTSYPVFFQVWLTSFWASEKDSKLQSAPSSGVWVLILSQLMPLTSSSLKCGFPLTEFTPILIESLTYCSCSAIAPADRPTPCAKPFPRLVSARTPHSQRSQNVWNSAASPPCPNSSPDSARSEKPRPVDASPIMPSSFNSA